MTKNYLFILLLFLGFAANSQIINIPDPAFKAKLLRPVETSEFSDANHNKIAVDANGDGEIQVSEALMVETLYFDNGTPYVADLTGIRYFTNLKRMFLISPVLTTLDLSGMNNLLEVSTYNNSTRNNLASINLSGLTSLEKLRTSDGRLTSLDLTGLTNLKHLSCYDNFITALDLSNLPNLQTLQCRENQLTTLDISNMPVLSEVHCGSNNLTQITLNNLPALVSLVCQDNQLSALDISGCSVLSGLNCYSNNLTTLNLASNPTLTVLHCDYNQLTTLDITANPLLGRLFCNNNSQLTSLFLKNGMTSFVQLEIFDNPALEYICISDNLVTGVQNYLISLGITGCTVNSYCSFTPGGTFYAVQGSTRYDENTNGCDAADSSFPFLKFSISNGTTTGIGIANDSGNYSIPLQAGSYTISALLENPAYFNVSPTNMNVSFPAASSPFIQNFCIAPNGIHNDLEVIILPTENARPGFDSEYKIIFKNKGTHTQGGTINVTFDDTVIDFVTSSVALASQALNTLSWNFTNLKPFETRVISFTLNLNSPTETPPLNDGDVNTLTATINGATDETVADNTFTLNQTIVNSYDPNDKTCLEGRNITPEKVGDYVHYVIRFENTGTAAAENIVVKDIIDTAKFDVNSLVPLDSSHSFVTKISNANKVEFIFENINLPFDDANNDGFVSFKIKTLPTLVDGNSFSNSASIYFDYNFPIVTDPAVTNVSALSTEDFGFGNLFSLSPVPTKGVLNITKRHQLQIKAASIYNTLGQLVQVNANPNDSIDVSELKSGSYMIRFVTDIGISSSKFIKE